MTSKEYTTIDQYIQTFPKEIQIILESVRQAIHEAAPEATEDIRYQMPTFRLNNKNLVHFAAWKNHIGFYPTPSGLDAFKKELSPYNGAKGSIQFPIEKPMPINLIKKITQYRVETLLQSA